MTGRETVRRLARRAALVLWPPLRARQEVVRNDLFEDAAAVALANMSAEGAESPVVDRDGRRWAEVELPPLRHRCRAHTAARGTDTLTIYWCACGAVRGDGMFAVWTNRNSRRR